MKILKEIGTRVPTSSWVNKSGMEGVARGEERLLL